MANAIEEYRKKKGIQGVSQSKNAIEEYRSRTKANVQDTPSPIELYRQQNGIRSNSSQVDFESSGGLYNLAVQSGLKDRADEILAKQRGEAPKEIYSGGLISDIFDTLSVLQYGVTGVLKGKSFSEGVKTRQSFTDQDALGDKGLPGMIAGIALDIAVDPLTYIAPWTVLNKIPGVTKGLKAGKAALFGKMATKTLEGAEEVGTKVFRGGDIGGLDLSKMTERGISVSKSEEVADFFTGGFGQGGIPGVSGVEELYLKPSAKILTLNDIPESVQEAARRLNADGTTLAEELEIVRYARSKGADAIDLSKWGEDEIRVLNPKIISRQSSFPKTYEALEGGTKVGRYLADKFVWMFGKDPVFRETIERGTKNIAIATQNIVDLTKSVSNIAPETAAKILKRDETGRFLRAPLEELGNILSKEELEPVAQLYKTIDDLGQEAVDLGLLSRETYQENIGEYIKNAYEEYEKANKAGLFPSSKVGVKNIFKRRKDVENVSEFGLTQIDNPAYLLFKSAFDLVKDVENARILKQVSDNFGTKVAQAGFVELPTGKRLGALAGKYIPEDMAAYLQPIVNPDPQTIGKQLVANFKFAKVIMNPGTHARNVMSNGLLNWWKLGLGPWRLDIYSEAVNQAFKGGKWVDEAKTVGYNLDTFASAEMKYLLDSPEVAQWGSKAGKAWQSAKRTLGEIYQKEENVAKLAAFIHHRKKGFNIEEAWKAAESATFNYAQVTPFVRKLRESVFGFPFITFAVKSTPVVAETALKNPARISVINKIKQGLEGQSDPEELARERAAEPPWVRDGFYVKLPMKDKNGRSAYFDLTYILPFGDLISGSLFERPIKRETGMPEGIGTTALTKTPLLNFLKEIGSNQDFYGNKIWLESDPQEKQLQDLFRHIVKTYAPPLAGDLLPGGYNERGERQNRGFLGANQASEENQKRTAMQELLRTVGLKTQPVEADIQESLQEWNTKKALTSLLLENFDETGLKEFNRLYIPKQ